MQNHNNDTIKTSDTVLFRKYTSHFIERVVCERELETEQNCNILTPTLMAITAFLSCSLGLLNWEPGSPASLGHGSHSSIFSPTPPAQSGVLKAPSAGYWFSLQHLVSNWLTSCLHPGYIIVWCPLSSCGCHKSHSIQPIHGQGYILIFLGRVHLLFTQVHFLFWQLGRGQYVTLAYYDVTISTSATIPISPTPPKKKNKFVSSQELRLALKSEYSCYMYLYFF